MSLPALASSLLAQAANNGGGGFLVGIPCVGGILGLLALALWIWALIDAIGNTRLEGMTRLIWVLVIIFVPVLGPILYLIIGRNSAA